MAGAAGHVARIAEKKDSCSILVRKPDEKRQLGRPRCEWQANIKMNIRERERGWNDVDRIRLLHTISYFGAQEPSGSINN
jgi:hypothetical protein